MKKHSIYPVFLLFLLCSVIFAQKIAHDAAVQEHIQETSQEAGQEQSKDPDIRKHIKQSESFSRNIAQITITALEPSLAVGAIGAYRYLSSSEEARGLLPWYCMPWFWVTCLIVYLTLHSPTALSVVNLPSQISSGLKALDKEIGLLLSSPVFVDQIINTAGMFGAQVAFSGAQPSSYLSASLIPWGLFSWLPDVFWFIAIVPMLFFVFFAIWLLNFVFDLLVFLCPFGFVDALLEFFRIALYAILLAAAVLIPQLVFVLIIPIVIISVLAFGWSVRRCVMGLVFFKDFIIRKKEPSIDEKGIVAFAGQSLGFPNRCCVRLTKKDETLLCSYKKFFLFKKTKLINNPELTLKKGVLYSGLYNNGTFICTLPLRYQKGVEKLQKTLDIHKIEESSLKKGLTGVLEWTKDILGKKENLFQNDGSAPPLK